MPELPEVETVCAGLRPIMEGRRLKVVIQRRLDLRFSLPAGFADTLKGAKVLSVKRRAKYILIRLNINIVLIIHLGMSGRMILYPEAAHPRVDMTILSLLQTTTQPFASATHEDLVSWIWCLLNSSLTTQC